MDKEKDKLVGKSVYKFIKKFYKDVDIVDMSLSFDTFKKPYIVVWYNQDNEVANDYIVFKYQIIEDVRNYLGFRLSPDHVMFGGIILPEFQNPDAYIDVRTNNRRV
jgi:hypothetical protein